MTLAVDHKDEFWMEKAILEAKKGWRKGEVPIGCVIVRDDVILARGYNLRESKNDPTGHAELIAIRKASKKLDAWRLLGCTLYVTLEPCTMCMGGIMLARIPKVVFGCRDPKGGAAGSLYNFSTDSRLNHRVICVEGVLKDRCSSLLSDFFKELRIKRRSDF